jgi:hypothetical protein
MSENDSKNILNLNLRCTVCGSPGHDKACIKCIQKYGTTYDLTTPDGRYTARVAEQGTLTDRLKLEIKRREELEERRKPLISRIKEKLVEADSALQEARYHDLATTLKGIELLSKKLKAIY